MTQKQPMTDDDKLAAKALAGCTFHVASWNKRFARSIYAISQSDQPELTEKQHACLWKLVYRFRQQIGDKRILQIAKPYYDRAMMATKRGQDDLKMQRKLKDYWTRQ